MIDDLFRIKEKDNLFFRKSQKRISFGQLSEDECLLIQSHLEVLESQAADIEKVFEEYSDYLKLNVTKIQYAFFRKIALEVRYIREDVALLRLSSDNHVRWLCLLYTSPSPRDRQKSRMPSSA